MKTLLLLAALWITVGCNEINDYGFSSISPISTTTVTEVSCSGALLSETITIFGFTFSPATTVILDEQIVKWVNRDEVTHTVTSGLYPVNDGRFDIILAPNSERCLRFISTGIFNYYCRPHPSMTGQITVK